MDQSIEEVGHPIRRLINSIGFHPSPWWWCFLLSVNLLSTGCEPQSLPSGVHTRVERVMSGQTIEVSQSWATVRLLGVDAPDNQQKPWGPAARDYLREQVRNCPVVLEIDESTPDPFGRTLAYVWCDRTLINVKLVEAGYAIVDVQRSPNPDHTQALIRAQEKARMTGVGIWDPKLPMRLTPQEFRRQNQ